MGFSIKDVKNFFSTKKTEILPTPQTKIVYPEAAFLFSETFDGEKEPGAIGVIKNYWVDHYALSYRSWQAFLDSDVAQLILKKYIKWVIGQGLRLNADPDEVVLKSEGINLGDEDAFSDLTESRFKIYSESDFSSHSGDTSLQMISNEAFKGAIIGGDILVINRVVNKVVTTQIIDGKFVGTPIEKIDLDKAKDNRIVDGIEINKAGKHIAFWVMEDNLKYRRVLAEVKGVKMAFMVYGSKYRTNDVRGVPLIVAILETISKLDRYKEATVGSAEERQKIAYAIKHDTDGTGQNPIINKLRQTTGVNITDQGSLIDTKQLVYDTVQKQVIDLPPGAELTLLESRNELYFESFMTINMRLLCATVGIPMEVAMSWYDSNYSASRAALKDWEHTLIVERAFFSNQFYKPIYSSWLDIEVFLGKIKAPGLGKAIFDKNQMAVSAYKNANFVGANIPHIDPVKEVMAERLKLGNDSIPLTTAQASTAALNSGSYKSNVNQMKRELKDAEDILKAMEPAEAKPSKEE